MIYGKNTSEPYLYDMVSNPNKWRLMLSSARSLRSNHNYLYTGKLGSNSLADVSVTNATSNLSVYAGSNTLKIATWKNATYDQWSFEPKTSIIAEMPEVVTSGTINNINGKAAPKFNNSYLKTGSAGYQTILNKTHTAFYLFKTPITERYTFIALEGVQSSSGIIGVLTDTRQGKTKLYYRWRPLTTHYNFGNQGTPPKDTLTLITVRFNEGLRKVEYRLNGVLRQIKSYVHTRYLSGSKSFYLGGLKPNNNKSYDYLFHDNTLAEICVINDYLPSNEMESIENNIMSFWGLI